MSHSEHLRELKKLLEATLEEFKSLFKSRDEPDGSRVGSGWEPDKVPVKFYTLPLRPVHEIIRIAESRKRDLFQPSKLHLIQAKPDEIVPIDAPKIRFVPYWKVQGFHECLYLRGKSYRIDVPDDVLAVRVEGKVRNLVLEASDRRTLLPPLLKKLAGRFHQPPRRPRRYFTMDDVAELARQFNEASFTLDGQGREAPEVEALLSGKPQLIEGLDTEQARASGVEIEVISPGIRKEEAVQKLHEAVVKPPSSFKQILTSRFEVTELAVIYVPFYIARYGYRNTRKELAVNGYTGEAIS